MKQVVQDFRTGELRVEEVPAPALKTSGVLVRNAYSLISSGTERSTIGDGQANLLGKAIRRPDLVSEVLENVKREGITNTYQKVLTRLNSPKALGYSSAGIVVETSPGVDDFRVGDRVACAGAGYASHAEVVFVPRNLCISIPPEVGFQEATFTTIGAIAMQGIRQAEVAVGDWVTVVGLGLVGLLTVQILKASGCRVIGLDINPEALAMAKDLGADEALLSTDPQIAGRLTSLTAGYGTDRVIITADTTSNEPVELAGKIIRDRGIIVIVGAVKIDIPRNIYYAKEVTVRLSRSYGPGRYDSLYEERGVDYPIGYVRWTEKRNMIAFLQLVAEGKINLTKMVSHVFRIDEAAKAYTIITGKTDEKYLAVLLDYQNEGQAIMGAQATARVVLRPDAQDAGSRERQLCLGLIGAGNFAQSYLLPHLRRIKGLRLEGVATATGINANAVGRKYGFTFCTTNNSEILTNPEINCILVATRHNLHAELVIEALNQRKDVFVEKPLALSHDQLESIIKAYDESSQKLMVGYNRRFSNIMIETKQFFHSSQYPLVIHYRVNAGFIPKNHWVQDPLEGGGRILGEVCHFVDLIQYLTDSEPISVFAESIDSHDQSVINNDNLNITIKMANGSLGVISYVSIGNRQLSKEYIEVFGGGSTVIIDDFRRAYFYSGRKRRKLRAQGKGHQEELESFINALKNGDPSPISFRSLVLTTKTTLCIHESLRTQLPIRID